MQLDLNPCCLADFELGPILGTGSFGRVHLATHKATGTVTAIKMLSKSQILKTKQVSHIKAEKHILDTVGYPFLVNMFASFQDDERLYFVLEYVVGGEFFTHLRSKGRFTEDTARYYAAQVLLSFEYIHSMDIVYRDLSASTRELDEITESTRAHARTPIAPVDCACPRARMLLLRTLDPPALRSPSTDPTLPPSSSGAHATVPLRSRAEPENLLLDKNGNVKVTDFGFAKKIDHRTYTLCGTPDYLAPEIILNKGHGKPVDWWALGVLIYEMLAGFPPFFDDDPMGTYRKILHGKIEFPPHFSRASRDIVKKLLQADLTKRYGNLKGGARDIKVHPWFSSIDFNALLNRKLTPPIVPHVKGESDTSNFDDYSDLGEMEHAFALCPAEQKLFEEW